MLRTHSFKHTTFHWAMSSTFSKPLPFNRLYKLAFILQDYFIFSLDLQYQIQLARGIVEELEIYDCRT
jgi:hypothetical protein